MSPAQRSYRSELRDAQAAATRVKVLEAAADCFSERGYQGTTLGAIAQRAAVSLETVKLQGAKSELLLGAYRLAVQGRIDDALFVDDADLIAVLEGMGSLHEIFQLQARMALDISRRSASLFLAVAEAARFDEAVQSVYASLLARRVEDYRAFIDLFVARGLIAVPADPEGAVTETAFLTSAEGYQHFVRDAGWSEDRYLDWMVDGLTRIFVPPASGN